MEDACLTTYQDKSSLCTRLVRCMPLRHNISSLDLVGKHALWLQTLHFYTNLALNIALTSVVGPFLIIKFISKS